MLMLVSACSLDPPARSVIKVILQFCKEASMHRSFEAIQVRLSFRFRCTASARGLQLTPGLLLVCTDAGHRPNASDIAHAYCQSLTTLSALPQMPGIC